MMIDTRDGDDQAAKRLSEYSDAVRRGESPDESGVDPAEAALIRELHRVGRSLKPDPRLVTRFVHTLDQIAAESAEPRQGDPLPRGPAPPTSPTNPVESGPQAVGPIVPFKTTPEVSQPAAVAAASPVVPLPPARPSGWRISLTAIAASLLLFVAVASSLWFFATNRGDDDNPTMPVAIAGSPTTSVAASPSSSAVATALNPNVESFLIFQKFTEASSAGKNTPVSEAFRYRTFTVPWDGIGTIILSGCRNRPCDINLDDEMYLVVTNQERKEEAVWVDDNGSKDGMARTLPILLTELFRPGDNVVEVTLLDKAGDQRGARSDIYILIVR